MWLRVLGDMDDDVAADSRLGNLSTARRRSLRECRSFPGIQQMSRSHHPSQPQWKRHQSRSLRESQGEAEGAVYARAFTCRSRSWCRCEFRPVSANIATELYELVALILQNPYRAHQVPDASPDARP